MSDDTQNAGEATGTNASTLTAVDTSDIAQMGYEQARDELASIVSTLESGRTPLEESMRLWERGEALADHCSTWLDGAQSRIEDAVARREGRDGEWSTRSHVGGTQARPRRFPRECGRAGGA